jgi:hypothetical protein
MNLRKVLLYLVYLVPTQDRGSEKSLSLLNHNT